jgi:O-antigen ligase
MTAILPALAGWARASLGVLAAVLPFELVATVRVGPLALSSVEVFLYAAVALGLAARAAERRTARDWRGFLHTHAGLCAFALALILSAVMAPAYRGAAIKFALRGLGGVVLAFVAADRLRAPGAAHRTARYLAAGAVAAALLAIAELTVPRVPALLAPFHERTFEVLGLPRASGPFQYPNIAAMYLEAALPVVLALGAATPRGALAATAGAVLLGWTVVLTGSRAGVLTAAVVLAATALYGALRQGAAPRRSAAALAALAAVAGAFAFGNSQSALRMRFWQDGTWHRATIRALGGVPARLSPDAVARVDLEVTNDGTLGWPASGPNPVDVSYHWTDERSGRTVVFDGVRTALPHDVAPGERARLAAEVRAPLEPGRYELRLDVVQEHVTWFGEQGNPELAAPVDVEEAATTLFGPAIALASVGPRLVAARAAPMPADVAPPPQVSRGQLWRAALAAFRRHPLFGLGPDNFRRMYGEYADLATPDERLHANSWYFETLSTLGAAGLVALALLIGTLWRAGRQAVRRLEPGSADGRLAIGVAGGLLAFFVHGGFDYFLGFTPTYALGWLLVGMLIALAEGSQAAAARPGP